jgi:hypothetical protein
MEKRSSSVFRIDEQVFFSMGIMAVIALAILGFRFKHKETCEEITITTTSANYYVKSLVSFKAETRSGKRYKWYFGDKSNPEDGGSSITHEFKNPGRYTVNVLVNGKCEQVINVDIKEAPVVAKQDLIVNIEGPDTAYVNKPVSFTDRTEGATSWEWSFDERGIIDSNTPDASYTFYTPGHHVVFLKINGRPDWFTRMDIYVKDPNASKVLVETPPRRNNNNVILPPIKDRPETPQMDIGGPPKQKDDVKLEIKPVVVRDIKPDEISNLLQDVVIGKKTAADFAEFLCNDLEITVKYNNKSMSFGRMCNELKEIKKLKRINKPIVTLQKDKTTNCVKSMDVTVQKKGWPYL